MARYDVIVVGARCSGAPTAMLLARRGLKVLLVDRSKFASDIAHGHFIHRGGPKRLHQWGLLDDVMAGGCPACTTLTLDFGEMRLVGRDLVADGVPFGCGPRRRSLDSILVDAAVKAGAEFRDDFAVEKYELDGNKVTGVSGRSRTAKHRDVVNADVTVGADGRGSLLARTVGAQEYDFVPTQTCWFFSYWSGVQATGLEVYSRRERVIFAFPTNDELFAVFIAWPLKEQRLVQADLERQFEKVTESAPELAARLRAGQRVERFYGAANLPNFLRRPYGPGWALVGDAGCHKDPYLALGVCDAFRDADLLASAIAEGLMGSETPAEAGAGYERRRNEETKVEYRQNIERAQFLPVPPEERALLTALHGNQEETSRFFKAREELMPRESFFNPENLGRIIAAAAH